jgi:predicted GNAT family acetyltransferase
MGFRSLCLNVDAGNESGALRLYEKVGMKAISEWHQYENPQWLEQ